MMHMSKMFQMYATKNFNNGRDIWLAGICRYLNDAYTSLATKVPRSTHSSPAHFNLVQSYMCEGAVACFVYKME